MMASGPFARGDDQRAAWLQQPIDRLQAVPCPGLDALAQRVVHGDGDIDFLGFVLRHSLLSVWLSVATIAKLFAGIPLRSGLSP